MDKLKGIKQKQTFVELPELKPKGTSLKEAAEKYGVYMPDLRLLIKAGWKPGKKITSKELQQIKENYINKISKERKCSPYDVKAVLKSHIELANKAFEINKGQKYDPYAAALILENNPWLLKLPKKKLIEEFKKRA
jgi:lambda repressor-like predicted transcriptional regulator